MKDLMVIIRLMMIEKKDILLSILFGFIAGITAVGLFAASGYLISKAALTPPFYTLIVITSTVKLLGVTKAIARYAERYFSHRATFTILSNLRVTFFKKLEPLAPQIFHKYRSGDLLSRIVGDVETLQNFFLRVFYPPIVLALVFLSTILFTAFFSFYIALVLLAGLILTGLVIPALFAYRQMKIDSQVRFQRGTLSTEATEFLHGFRDLKIYQKLNEKEQKLIQSSDAYIREQKTENINKLYSESVNSFVTLFISWLVLALGSYLVIEGQLEGILLAMLVMISLTVFEDAAPMAAFPIHYQDSKRAQKRLSGVVEDSNETNLSEHEMETLQANHAIPIVMDDVSFTFQDELRPALKNIHLTIAPGTKTAIVGPSGSGKSTLMQLLLKMSIKDHGNILIDHLPVEQIEQESIWRNTNVVLQENHFFFGTIRDNLLLVKDNLTDTDMAQALEKVGLSSFSLDDAVYEKGENLSGGEKQRLAITRVLLKDANLWLLDEPTSSVDALTEQMIYKHMFEQAKNDTLILISHRLTNLDQMDQIIVMDQGSIIESGTFEKLMQQKGYLYEMKQIEQDML
ncbi:thiol reductant ABC exporter subunit CydC [Lentibacillus amyloliquefaciens]|uniref:ABC transporter ATP-binding protein n=1 Tax=Lentibacillus amyloliquefaciens TaxID=1472767 RepID=A0A0U3W2D1_9BACI|nr:thiol reductant ABC exporter subunit CydC [Lentibacillus amyloliquefaciens]ALX47330.1 ABC transporter ATP-binding protein [Lentibacillus amyloliquefaciens]